MKVMATRMGFRITNCRQPCLHLRMNRLPTMFLIYNDVAADDNDVHNDDKMKATMMMMMMMMIMMMMIGA